MKGELHATKKPVLRRTFLHMDDSVKICLICFLVWPLPETAMVDILFTCLEGGLPYARYGDTITPFVRSQGAPPRTNEPLDPHPWRPRKKTVRTLVV